MISPEQPESGESELPRVVEPRWSSPHETIVTTMTSQVAPPRSQPDSGGTGIDEGTGKTTVSRRWPAYRFPPLRWPTASGWVTAFALAAMTVFVVVQLHPDVLFSGTLTDGGDMGAHVYLPWFMRHSLLGQGRITGWSPGWYAGFPIFTFYFPLPSLFIALASFVIPYGVAFKLVTASGLVIMPISAWAMAKLAGWKPPVPVAMAAATLPLLFERSFTIDGGNIASTMAGEYSFAISLSVGLILLGLVARGLDTGRHRALAAVLFAVVAMCHVLPAMFIAACAVLLLLLQMGRRRLWWGLSAGLTGSALTAVWLLPFEWRIGYSTDMGWSPVTDYAKCLFPYNATSQCTTTPHSEVIAFGWFVGLAAVGAVISVVRWAISVRKGGWGSGCPHRLGVVLAVMGAASAGAFVLAPASAVYNARALPFWFLCVYLLGGVAIGEAAAGAGWLWRWSTLGRLAANWWIGADLRPPPGVVPGSELSHPGAVTGDQADSPPAPETPLAYPPKTWHPGALAGAIFVTLLALYYVALPLRIVTWLPGTVPVAQKSFVPAWVDWNYSGYQSRATWPEYHGLMTTMSNVGASDGCGPAMWEYDPSENNFGTPMALMLLPYWTNGCIDSMEGLLFESSSTTPYHFINQAELSDSPSEAMRNIPYAGMDVPLAVGHLQQLGVRYLMAYTYDVVSQAKINPNLQLVATSGPWTGSQSITGNPITWSIFRVKGSSTVTPLADQPAVMTGPGAGATGNAWLDASMAWYTDQAKWNVVLTADGPASWQRVKVVTAPQSASSSNSGPIAGAGTTLGTPSPVPLPPVHVSHLVVSTHSMSFDVDRIGVPVEVRTSYFPNWKASGATGPYRATPNEMVVVPTSHHVVVYYGYTPIDLLGWLLTLAGIAAVVAMARRRPIAMPAGRAATGIVPGVSSPPPGWGTGMDSADVVPGKLDPGMGKANEQPGALGAIFKAYDVRGTVPDQLDFPTCRAIGVGFALFLRVSGNLGASNRVLVARDMRESGVELAGAFMAGVRSQGVDVVDLGLASTDMAYFASGKLDAPAAVFTASHNPARYNGIKFCLSGARPIGVETGLAEIEKIAESLLGPNGPSPSPVVGGADSAVGVHTPPSGSLVSMNMLDAFADHVRSFVDVSALEGLTIVADTANGMGGLVVPAVFSGIRAELEILFPELDGTFPNHPADPIQPENLTALIDRVVETGADVGLAFDGDADRVFLVDERGNPVSGSLTTAMVAKSMLDKHPGATVLYNAICSKTVREVISENGGTGIRTRVGHSFIKAIMAETGAVFGGEHSGHYYFRENYRADSGLVAALVVLEMLAESGKPLSELCKPFERYAASGEINSEVADPAAVIEAVEESFRGRAGVTMDHLDGLTVDMNSWWFNLRPSNTEPLLRLNLEAPTTEECDEHVEEVLGIVKHEAGAPSRSGGLFGLKPRGGRK